MSRPCPKNRSASFLDTKTHEDTPSHTKLCFRLAIEFLVLSRLVRPPSSYSLIMLHFIKQLASSAGQLAQQLRNDIGGSGLQTSSKANDKDLVTLADRQVEDFVIAEISRRYPEHGILAEESGLASSASPYLWVIDPIDGTASYIHEQPGYCVSIALRQQDRTQYAAVCAPVFNQLYHASLGGGAYCNDKPIRVIDHGDLSQSQVATGFSCLRAGWDKINNLQYFCALARQAREVRRYGSAALDLCWLAAGKIDAFWELNLQEYDVAAGSLIVTEAGGEICDLQGGNDYPRQGMLACNGAAMQKTMLEYFKEYKRPQN